MFALASIALGACGGGAHNAEDRSRLDRLRKSTAASYIPPRSSLVLSGTNPACVEGNGASSINRDFRVDGSVVGAAADAKKMLARAGWILQSDSGKESGGALDVLRRVEFVRAFEGGAWFADAEILVLNTPVRFRSADGSREMYQLAMTLSTDSTAC